MLLSALLTIGIASAIQPTSTHELHAQVQPYAAFPAPPSVSPGTPDITVYGYIPYWTIEPLNLDFDSLTHVAWFSVGLEANGNVTGAAGWESIAPDLIAVARESGTKVHLCVTLFSESALSALLNNTTNRQRAVSQLAALVNDHGADGINIDFENLPDDSRDSFVTFTNEMQAAVDEVYLAMPAVGGYAYDYDRLSDASDGLFIMAYDYHYKGGNPGPVAPLTAGSYWGLDWALDWTLDDYRTWGATDDKIIMGLPVYGYEWKTTDDSVPGTRSTTDNAVAFSMASILADLDTMDARYDELTDTPWAWTGDGQLWYDDPESLEIKLSWSAAQGVQGIGFWALGYDGGDVEFWEMVDSISGADVADEPDPVAEDTGDAADTGDEPDGNTGDNDDDDDVGDAEELVTADSSENDTEKAGCGCASATLLSGGWWVLVPLIVSRRRQN